MTSLRRVSVWLGTLPLALTVSAIGALPSGCATGAITQEQSMSAGEHAAKAQAEESIAAQEREKYDPKATRSEERCTGHGGETCWSADVNTTESHLRASKKHAKIAAQHRAASQQLRDAEARSCAGVAAHDRDVSPFTHREDLIAVEAAPHGARVTIKAVKGLTSEYLQSVMACHLARNAALGHEATNMAFCPLMVKDLTVTVSPGGAGFVVDIRAKKHAEAVEVLRRVRALVAPLNVSMAPR